MKNPPCLGCGPMANRDNHYEAAFEEFLRGRGVPYMAVDEAKRSVLSDGASLKSLDFLVSSGLDCRSPARRRRAPTPRRVTWLVDVKGRRFPSGDIHKQYWKNWSTRDDLRSLAQWEGLFGEGFRGLFVFAYDVLGRRAPLAAEELFEYRGSLYGFVAVTLADYAGHARPISPRWDTWAMPADDFRRFARPLTELLGQNRASTPASAAVVEDMAVAVDAGGGGQVKSVAPIWSGSQGHAMEPHGISCQPERPVAVQLVGQQQAELADQRGLVLVASQRLVQPESRVPFTVFRWLATLP